MNINLKIIRHIFSFETICSGKLKVKVTAIEKFCQTAQMEMPILVFFCTQMLLGKFSCDSNLLLRLFFLQLSANQYNFVCFAYF